MVRFKTENSGRGVKEARMLWEHGDWVQFPAPRCGCSTVVSASAFQAEYVGSIPITRSKYPWQGSLKFK